LTTGPGPRDALKAFLEKLLGGKENYDAVASTVTGGSEAVAEWVKNLSKETVQNPVKAYENAWRGGVLGAASDILRFPEMVGAPVTGAREKIEGMTPESTAGRTGAMVGLLGPEFTPAGDIAAVGDAAQFAGEGRPFMATLAGLGALPLVPSTARLLQKAGEFGSDAGKLVEPAEKIVEAAVRTAGKNPQIFRGAIHAIATGEARAAGIGRERRLIDGFVTDKGRFVNRKEAYRIARAAEQVGPGMDVGGGLISQISPSGLARNRPAAAAAEEMLTLRHHGPGALEDTIDPAFMGTGRPGAEKARPDRIPAMHYYNEGTPTERQFQDLPSVEVKVPSKDVLQDMDKLVEFKRAAEARGLRGAEAADAMERAVRDAGYKGYTVNGVTKMFEPVKTGTANLDAGIARRHSVNGGSTTSPHTGEAVGEGWAVATPAQKLQDEPFTPEQVAAFRSEHADLLKDPKASIGTWNDAAGEAHGKHELNVTRVYRTKDAAVRAAAVGDEQSIMDLSNFETYAPTARERADVRYREGTRTRTAREATVKEIEAGLLPEEVAQFRAMDKGTRERTIESYLRAPTPRTLASASLEGGKQLGWYDQSARSIAEAFGPDGTRFAALAAALSPQKSVRQNLIDSLNMWREWNAAGRPTDRAAIEALVPRTSVSWKSAVPNAEAALKATVDRLLEHNVEGLLSGPKVDPFWANLIGNTQRVVLDTHMARGLGTDPNTVGSVARNLASRAALRNTAGEVEKLTGFRPTPAEVQETVWSTIYGARNFAGRGSVAGAIPGSREMDLFGQTRLQEAIGDAPSFGTLFEDPEIAGLLESAGGRPLTGDYRPGGLPAEIPEGSVRPQDLADIGQRIDEVGAGRPLFSAGGGALAGGAIGSQTGSTPEERRRNAFIGFLMGGAGEAGVRAGLKPARYGSELEKLRALNDGWNPFVAPPLDIPKIGAPEAERIANIYKGAMR